MPEQRIKVLVVDDSALIRHLLTEILSSDPGIEVVGVASDPFIAREKIKRLSPDVITLDVEMPRMDGLQFLRNIMRLRPMPVVMVSSLTQAGAAVTLEALELGAVDFVAKPEVDVAEGIKAYADDLIEKVRAASVANVSRLANEVEHKKVASKKAKITALNFGTTDKILAIGASTGGTEAIREVLQGLPADTPGTVIVQHIPGMFSSAFAKRMDGCSEMTVFEAEDGMRVLHGHVYIAPGGKHLRLRRDGARYYCVVDETEPVNRHRPSADVLFESVAREMGKNAMCVLLTGMGKDGAAGMLAMREAGALTLAQDEASSVVWGMPGAAYQLGAVQELLPLRKIAPRLSELYHALKASKELAVVKGQ
jgi:two-component system chemotaxis response regulator CheB